MSATRDLGFAMKLVLVIDAKAIGHILHRQGIRRMENIDVSHLWLQDEARSNTLKVRRVREHIVVALGTKALSQGE